MLFGKKSKVALFPLRIAAVYAVVGALWILFSDKLLLVFADNPLTITQLQTFKGWFFVAASAALLYGIMWSGLSDIRRANDEVQKNEERLRRLTDNASDMIYRMSLPDGKYEYVSPASIDLLGYTPEEFYNSPILINKIIHPDWQEYFREEWEKLLAGDMPLFYEYQVVDKSGATRWLNQRNILVRDELTRPIAIEGIVTDITTRKQAEEALRESEDRFASAFHTSPAAITITRVADGKFIDVNQAFLGLFEFNRDEVIGHMSTELNILSVEQRAALIRAQLETDGLRDAELLARSKSGRLVHLLFSSKPIELAGETHHVTTLIDITVRKRAEEELKKFVLLADSSSDFIGMCDLDMNPLYVNPAGQRMVGLPDMAAACRVRVQDYFFQEDRRFIAEEFFPRVLREGHGDVEIRLRHFQTGEPIWVFYSLFNVCEASGKVVGWATVSRDITERRRMENELKKHRDHLEVIVKERTQELEETQEALVSIVEDLNEKSVELAQAMKQAQSADRLKSAFLATMSHELRTPLNSIIGFTGIVLQGLPGPLNEEQAKQLTMVKGSANHLLNLINDVLDISKIEAGQVQIAKKPFDMRSVIDAALRSVMPQAARKGLSLDCVIASDVGLIISDRRRVEQILINLVNNAVKFTERGAVSIECRTRDGLLETCVRDTGIGIKAEDVGRLFIPFSQIDTGLTRSHEGTGLGLSICAKLVEMLGGVIRVESEWGKGSKYIFTLPLS